MTPPALVYLGMGLLVARILLDGTKTRGYSWLQWAQFLFNGARITLLWPLVLLIEKVEIWLKSGAESPALPVIFPAEKMVEKTEAAPSGGEER
jgi:hypothetical protein